MCRFDRDNYFEALSRFRLDTTPSPLQAVEYESWPVVIKRDDLNQLGSSKQRSIAYLINEYLKKGKSRFVISSSGNAGLVAAYCALQESEILDMKVFLSRTISDQKLMKYIKKLGLDVGVLSLRSNGLKHKNLDIQIVEDPRQAAFELSKNDYINIRGSTDDMALLGFYSIVDELLVQYRGCVRSVFIPSSSGTTALGVYQAFKSYGLSPAINVVQTSKVFTLVRNLVPHPEVIESDHPADSIVDYIGYRRAIIEKIVIESGGRGWIITAEDTLKSQKLLRELFQIDTSPDSALAFAAFLQSQQKDGAILLFTG